VTGVRVGGVPCAMHTAMAATRAAAASASGPGPARSDARVLAALAPRAFAALDVQRRKAAAVASELELRAAALACDTDPDEALTAARDLFARFEDCPLAPGSGGGGGGGGVLAASAMLKAAGQLDARPAKMRRGLKAWGGVALDEVVLPKTHEPYKVLDPDPDSGDSDASHGFPEGSAGGVLLVCFFFLFFFSYFFFFFFFFVFGLAPLVL
jgi:hypothetical protein